MAFTFLFAASLFCAETSSPCDDRDNIIVVLQQIAAGVSESGTIWKWVAGNTALVLLHRRNRSFSEMIAGSHIGDVHDYRAPKLQDAKGTSSDNRSRRRSFPSAGVGRSGDSFWQAAP